MSETFDLQTPSRTQSAKCEHCSTAFTPRQGTGGKPQRFCGEKCRTAFHAVAQREQRGTTCSEENEPTASGDLPDKKLAQASPPSPTDFRHMLIEGCKDFDAKVRTETAEEAVDNALASGKVKCPGAEGEFDWVDDDTIVLRPQSATAVYLNEFGDLVVRQERAWDREEDTFVIIGRDSVNAFVDRICDVIGVPSVGRNG